MAVDAFSMKSKSKIKFNAAITVIITLTPIPRFEEEFNKEIDKAANHSPEDDEFF